MKYRSRMDIMALMLRSAMRGASKTKLMYGACLSYAQLKEYLPFMEQKDLLTMEDEHIYRLTPRGLQFLNVYDGLTELMTYAPNKKEGKPEVATASYDEYPVQMIR